MESGLAQEARGKGVRSVLRATDKNMQTGRRIVIVIGGSRGKTEARVLGLKKLAKVSEASRKSWLESLCEAKAEASEGSKEMVLRRLIRIEDQRKNARIIGRVDGKLQSGSVTSVVAPNEDGSGWK